MKLSQTTLETLAQLLKREKNEADRQGEWYKLPDLETAANELNIEL